MAPEPEPLDPRAVERIEAVAFDCYGTLLDFEERAFAPALQTLLEARGVRHVNAETVWTEWMTVQRELHQARGHSGPEALQPPDDPDFATMAVLWRGYFAEAFRRTGVERITPADAQQHLFNGLSRAPAYPDAAPVVRELRARGVRLMIASNADDAHLQPALEQAGLHTLPVLSSEGARVYKPRRRFFQMVMEQLDLPADRILYVGDSPVADAGGARTAGMPAYLVRRYDREPPAGMELPRPNWVSPDLRAVLDILGIPIA